MDQVKAVVKVETGVMDKATAEALVARNTRVAVKAKTLAEDRVVVGIAEAEQAVLVLLVS